MANAWKQCLLFAGIGFRSQTIYASDFLVGAFGTIALNAVDLVMLGVLLQRFQTVGGWSVWEIVFLYSFYLAALGLQGLFAGHVERIDYYIQDGTFDQFLTRPASPLVQLLGREISYQYIIHLAMGIACMGMAYVKLDLHWSPFMWVYFCVLILSGAVVLAGVALGLCSFAFWTVQSRMLLRGTLQVQEAVQHYPAHIFGRWFEIFTTVVLPYAFAGYYPSLLLLGRAHQALLPILSWSTPLVALVVMLGGMVVWRMGIRHYKSTGS